MRRYQSLVLALVLCDLLTACLKRTPMSEPLHDFGALVGDDPRPYLWVTMSPEKFYEGRNSGDRAYPASHPRVARLEQWLHAMDGEIRKTVANVPAPEPQILIVENPNVNAFVPSVPVCLDIRVTQSDGAGLFADSTVAILGIHDVRIKPYQDIPCLKTRADGLLLKSILEHSLGLAPSCYTIQADSETTPASVVLNLKAEACASAPTQRTLLSLKSARQIIYRAIPNVIVVHDKLFDLAEGEVVSILAHELGHYYRFHIIADETKYGYFFQLDEKHNLGRKPDPLPASHPIAILGKESQLHSSQYLNVAAVAQQKYHSLVFESLANGAGLLIFACGNDTSCTQACNALDKHLGLESPKKKNVVGGFPLFGNLPTTPQARKYYRDYEVKAQACFEKVKIKEDLYPRLFAYLHEFPIDALDSKLNIESYTSFQDMAADLSAKLPSLINQQNTRVIAIVTKANTDRVGIYTDEQEADEIGLELAHRVGIDTKVYGESFLSALKAWEAERGPRQPLPGILDYEACKTQYDKGFPDFIPIGQYADPHHSTCFRVFNSFREVKAHEKELAAIPPYEALKPDPTLWERLRKQGL